jgi:hypothetical protein
MMDQATIGGTLNEAVRKASGSEHFREHFNEAGDRLVFEYHFTALPGRLDVGRVAAVLDRLDAIYWTGRHEHSDINIDGALGGRDVSVVISLRKEPG